MAITASGRHSVTHYDTLRGLRRHHAARGARWRPAGPTRSGCTWPRSGIPASAIPMYGGDPVLAARLGLDRQWLHAVRLGFTHPTTRRAGDASPPPTPTICSTPWTSSTRRAWSRAGRTATGQPVRQRRPSLGSHSCVEQRSCARWGRRRRRRSVSPSWSRPGMDVARLNMSHGDYSDHKTNLRQRPRGGARRPVGRSACSPTSRARRSGSADSPPARRSWSNGATFTITIDDIAGTVDRCSTTYKGLPGRRQAGRRDPDRRRPAAAGGDRGHRHRRGHQGRRRRRRQQQQGHQPARASRSACRR